MAKAFSLSITDTAASGKKVTGTVSIDAKGRVKTTSSTEGTTFYTTKEVYTSNNGTTFEPYELTIIKELRLDKNAPWVRASSSVIGSEYSLAQVKSTFVGGITGDIAAANPQRTPGSTKFRYEKTGDVATLTMTLADLKRTAVFTITRGAITGAINIQADGSSEWRIKPFTGSIILPKGPFLEWKLVADDPRFRTGRATQLAELQITAFYREALSYAALDRRSTPSTADWAGVVARSDRSAVLYDKGIEFRPTNDTTIVACGVFGKTVPKVKLSTCSELGHKKR